MIRDSSSVRLTWSASLGPACGLTAGLLAGIALGFALADLGLVLLLLALMALARREYHPEQPVFPRGFAMFNTAFETL